MDKIDILCGQRIRFAYILFGGSFPYNKGSIFSYRELLKLLLLGGRGGYKCPWMAGTTQAIPWFQIPSLR
jgi:hypothetical protein